MQVQKELEEERVQAEEQQRLAQEAIQAKVAELRAIEAAQRQEVWLPRTLPHRLLVRCHASVWLLAPSMTAESKPDIRGIACLLPMLRT